MRPGSSGGLLRRGHAPAAGVQAPSGPGWRAPRGGRGGRGCGLPCNCRASPTGCTVPCCRRTAPRAESGRGWSGSACVRECARRGAASARPASPPSPRSVPLACRGRAALSRVRAPSPPPPLPPPFCELESVTGVRVAARPSGTDSSGWKETQQPERPKRRSVGTEDARPEPGPQRGHGAGVWLVSREMGDFFK